MRNKHLLAAIGVLMITVSSAASWGQLLPQSSVRCADASAVTQAVAQARYTWAAYCKAHPAPGIFSGHYLSNESVAAYNDPANAAIRSKLYPAYYNFSTSASWNMPQMLTGANGIPQTACTALPAVTSHVGLCVQGCFPPDALVTYDSGDVSIQEAYDRGLTNIVTLAPEASLDGLRYMTNHVAAYSRDLEDGWHKIFTFTTASGGRLRVTDEHPVLVADGRIKPAKVLTAGELFIREDGSTDEVVSIDVESYFGKVYHLKPTTLDYTTNLIVAQGYLNGSSRYQNEFVDMVNRVTLRRALSELPLDAE